MNSREDHSRLIVDNPQWDAGRAAAESMEFLRDVVDGLSRRAKSLSCKHFYDAEGSRLFERIMRMPEYYPTRCETEILRAFRGDILSLMDGLPFNLVDLGAGDAAKTRILLEHFHRRGALLSYVPVDVSGDALARMAASVREELPGLTVHPLADEYFPALDRLNGSVPGRKLVLFLGSTIGNFEKREAAAFLKGLRDSLEPDDALLIGFDLRKEPGRVLRAYDDASGLTARFNLNLLERINRELEADFDPDGFVHHAVYDPEEGVARSYLVSRREQAVRIRKAGLTLVIGAWESIHTENAFKYAPEEIRRLAEAAGFVESAVFQDREGLFQDSFLTFSR
ncbi:MAG: L-histidine N(alpha)-methyltransferase [Fibrobacteres bacterium]|nr:L-histidine N(alpha)-methyltransferase [Fibrobacterota bacterium]